jgi:Na+-transporting methylmalonyl-CoA/oxaloacetate decarboxylase gamma subunit
MYGLEAISAADGWQMAALGISIVFLSLVILAIVISQLHNLLALWEKRKTLVPGSPAPEVKEAPPNETGLPHPPVCPDEIDAVAVIWSPLVEQLESPFPLPDLYRIAAENNFPHPHLTINRLRQAGKLIPAGSGRFSWKQA